MTSLAQIASPLRPYLGLFLLAILIGCSGGPSHHDSSWIPAQVTDVSMVVGEWEGTITKGDDWLPTGSVRLTVRQNGSYLFAGQNKARLPFVGTGSLIVRDGLLIGDSGHRSVTFTLYDHKGKAVLAVESTSHETGARYHGDFTKAQ